MNKVRFRVVDYGQGRFYLKSQSGAVWCNGSVLGGYAVNPKDCPYAYFKTEAEAWAQAPKDVEILLPDTPLWCVRLWQDAHHWDDYYVQEKPVLSSSMEIEHLTGTVLIPDTCRYMKIEVYSV